MSDMKPYPTHTPGTLEEVYDTYRTARFSAKYYGEKLARLQWWNTTIEIALALGTSGTVAAVLVKGPLNWLVPFLAGVAAILGVLKPILALSKKIERASKLWSGYNAVFNSMRRVAAGVKAHEGLTPELLQLHRTAADQVDTLSEQDDTAPDGKTLKRIFAEIDDEIPASSLWFPAAQG